MSFRISDWRGVNGNSPVSEVSERDFVCLRLQSSIYDELRGMGEYLPPMSPMVGGRTMLSPQKLTSCSGLRRLRRNR